MKFIKNIIRSVFFIFAGFILLNLCLYIYAFITPKQDIRKNIPYTFYDKDSKVFLTGNSKGKWIKLDDMGNNIINATLSVEDKNFYNHKGFDYLRIVKSMYLNIVSGKIVGGASTITQQYAKNLYLTFDKNWSRKIEEAVLTFELETHYSKKTLLEGYLNTINYGKGVFGIENAANFYFGKSARELSIAEATMLVGIPNSPSNYSPLVDEYAAKKRQNVVLNMMVRNKYISKDEKEKAYSESLSYIGNSNEDNLSTLMYYQDAVLNELKKIKTIPNSLIKNGGIKIFTCLDIDAQKNMEDSITKNMKNTPEAGVSSIMMNPNNGEIIALAGGVNYVESPYNRVTKSKRQVGSTMKTFLYYAALENGFNSSTTFLSTPTTFTFGNNQTYSPKNYADKYGNTEISLAAAISYSENIYAVKTHMFLGEEVLVDIAKRVGIDEKLEPIPSLPLGTIELNLIDYIGGYSSFANEGYKIDPHLIRKIEDNNGNVLYEAKINSEKILDSNNVYILNELLSNTYNYNFIDYNTPTLISVAPKLKNKYAVKSGTTNTDFMTVGYNKDVIIGVWYGYDNNKPVDSSDSRITKNIWADTIESYFKNKTAHWYSIPDDVIGVLVNPITGKLSKETDKKKQILYYIKGSEPTNNSNNAIDEYIFQNENKSSE